MSKRNHPEDQLQRAVVQYLRYVCPHVRAFHVPNGGKRSKVEAGIFKAMGVMPGVADLLIFWSVSVVHDVVKTKHGKILPILQGGAIELKAGKNTVTDAQKVFREWWTALGGKYALCRSLEDVQKALSEWGIEQHKAELLG